MAQYDAEELQRYSDAIRAQVVRMQRMLREHRVRSEERCWLKGRTVGELDTMRLVDGVAGSMAVFKHRGVQQQDSFGQQQERQVSIRFVMDISGSMYTFNRSASTQHSSTMYKWHLLVMFLLHSLLLSCYCP